MLKILVALQKRSAERERGGGEETDTATGRARERVSGRTREGESVYAWVRA